MQPMRVRVALEAWPALRLRYGFQASEERPESDPPGDGWRLACQRMSRDERCSDGP